jgi:hypothetical protein
VLGLALLALNLFVYGALLARWRPRRLLPAPPRSP